MKQIVGCTAAFAMLWLSLAGAQTAKKAPQKTAPKTAQAAPKSSQAPAKKSAAPVAHKAAARPGSTATKSATTKKGAASASSRRSPAKKPAVTWRNRQVAPSSDRYREIQGALAQRGYLSAEEATGAWNQASIDALKKFQGEQNLEASGKINSLSLIALGLGPKREAVVIPPKPPEQTAQPVDR